MQPLVCKMPCYCTQHIPRAILLHHLPFPQTRILGIGFQLLVDATFSRHT